MYLLIDFFCVWIHFFIKIILINIKQINFWHFVYQKRWNVKDFYSRKKKLPIYMIQLFFRTNENRCWNIFIFFHGKYKKWLSFFEYFIDTLYICLCSKYFKVSNVHSLQKSMKIRTFEKIVTANFTISYIFYSNLLNF